MRLECVEAHHGTDAPGVSRQFARRGSGSRSAGSLDAHRTARLEVDALDVIEPAVTDVDNRGDAAVLQAQPHASADDTGGASPLEEVICLLDARRPHVFAKLQHVAPLP